MVGAGFSRNADAVSATARQMPTWRQMAEALCEPLYPENDARRGRALSEAAGTSGFLRLAQEYQVAFGPSALNDKIRSLVPDLDYRPADLHKRLLRLPWADVFSTNWDTLLERSCVDVFDRSYDVIRTANEIPFAMRPRIVKLHGTFPAHEPFIFTEEEYRTYPGQFSPFVNLVQQSMMETIFCLIGFSGDDPNFLHWSGWVRDNLAAGAPRIYLAGWLGLSNHRRRMLEARNVMPIDLSALPQANTWPPDLRDRYATEWFITALELGKPSGFSSWPSPPTAPAAPPPYLSPVPVSEELLPLEEKWPPPFTSPANEHEQALRSIIGIWRENRRLYPGWLVAPARVRERLWQSTQAWLFEFSRHLQPLSIFERLLAPHDPWLACQLAIRIETNDKLVDDVFSRARVARLSRHNVELSKAASLRRLAFGRELLGSHDVRFGDVAQVVGAAVEVLSRVAVRLNREQLRQLFFEATSYYRIPVFRLWFRLLGNHLANLLARVLETLSRDDIIGLLPLLFELPLPQEDTPIDPRFGKDPVAKLPDWFDGAVDRVDTRSVQWEGIVSHLVIAAKNGNAADREAAISRLYIRAGRAVRYRGRDLLAWIELNTVRPPGSSDAPEQPLS